MTIKAAIFIDGDNIHRSRLAAVASLCGNHWPAAFTRVYADVGHIDHWATVPGLRAMLSGGGKNATDLLLTIEAMEFALLHPGAPIVLVSSDQDFTHLALRLRERGHPVIGIGEPKTPGAFRAACTEFNELPVREDAASRPATTPLREWDERIRATIAQHGKQGAGMPVAQLATLMRQQHGITIGSTAEKRWRPYLAARSDLFDLDPQGPQAHVRFRAAGFATAQKPATAK